MNLSLRRLIIFLFASIIFVSAVLCLQRNKTMNHQAGAIQRLHSRNEIPGKLTSVWPIGTIAYRGDTWLAMKWVSRQDGLNRDTIAVALKNLHSEKQATVIITRDSWGLLSLAQTLPDGRLLCSDLMGAGLSIINPFELKEQVIAPYSDGAYKDTYNESAKITTKGDRVIYFHHTIPRFGKEKRELWVADPATLKKHPLVTGKQVVRLGYDWMHDGSGVVFLSKEVGKDNLFNLWLKPIGSGKEILLQKEIDAGRNIRVSPSGDRLLITHPYGFSRYISVMDMATRETKQIYKCMGDEWIYEPIEWTNDGRFIFFQTMYGERLWRVAADGSSVKIMDDSITSGFVMSQDREKLLYSKKEDKEGGYSIWSLKTDGTERKRIWQSGRL